MLKLSHLTIRHTKDLRDLVRDLSLTIHEGEKVAIIGEEGNGKYDPHVWLAPENAKKEMENLPYFRFLCPQNLYQII